MDTLAVSKSRETTDNGPMRSLRLALLTVVAFTLFAPAANAGLLVKSAPSCSGQVLTQPFAPFGDSANYTPVPGGSFESDSHGWSLSRASVVSGNSPFKVGGASHARSLQISPGGVATSPTVCVGLEHPTMRFFVRSSGNLLQAVSTMTVSVLAESSLGIVVEVPVGVQLFNKNWKASSRHIVVANLLPLLPNNYTPVAFRFRAVGGATWTIDDVYVDPRKRS
jgi:hypothetical protein